MEIPTTYTDQATAARSIVELKAALETLKALEGLALGVRRRSADTKWRELASLLGEIFTATGRDGRTGETAIRDSEGPIPRPAASPHQKLVIFTEHRDTLRYLQERITTLLGRQTSVVVITAASAARTAWRRRKRSGTTRRCRCCWPPTPPAKASTCSAPT